MWFKVAKHENEKIPPGPTFWNPVKNTPKIPEKYLDGGNRVLVETNFGASETLFLKALWSLKNGLD